MDEKKNQIEILVLDPVPMGGLFISWDGRVPQGGTIF